MLGAWSFINLLLNFRSPTEAPVPPEPLSSPEETVKPLMECMAWLDAYFQEPTALQELPVPALHHPVFLQGQYLRHRRASFREQPR